MRLNITFSLLVVLLALLAYIVFFDPWKQDEDPADASRSILGPLAAQIDYLDIHNPSQDSSVQLEKRAQGWFLVEPYLWPANAFAVDRILSQMRFLQSETSFETSMLQKAEAGLGDYGLDPPDLTLTFGYRGERHQLGIGRATDIGRRLYVSSIDGERVHVVNRSLLESLSIDLDELRDDQVFASNAFEVDSWNIQLRAVGNLRSRLSKSNGKWLFETPFRARADSTAVESLLNQVLQLEAKTIVDPNPSDLSLYGLQTPSLRLVVESHRGRESIEVGNPIDKGSDTLRYAKRAARPAVFETEIAFLDLLENAQTALRDRRIHSLDAKSALTVSIREFDGSSLALQSLEGDGWQILIRNQDREMSSRQGDPEAIAELLSWLDNLKAVPKTGFPNDAPSSQDLERYGLQAPNLSIAVTSPRQRDTEAPLDTPVTETILLGDPNPDNPDESYLKLKERPFVYLVYNDFFEQIDSSPLRYQNRQLIDAPSPESVVGIRIERLSDEAAILDTENPDSLEGVEASKLQELRRAIHQLRAHRFVSETYTSSVEIAGRQAPWAYRIQIDLDNESAASSQSSTPSFFVSEVTGGPLLLGGSIDRDLVFRFPQSFVDAFSNVVHLRPMRPIPQDPFGDGPDDPPAEDETNREATSIEGPGEPERVEAPSASSDAPTDAGGESSQENPEPSESSEPPSS